MNDIVASILLLGAMSSGGSLPFWAVSNNFGLMPSGSGALALVQAYSQPSPSAGPFTYNWGASFAGNISGGEGCLMVDELYAGVGWKKLGLEVGMKHHGRDYLASGSSLGGDNTLGSISSTGGHLVWSGNARTMPGYTLTLSPLALPFTGGHVRIHGAYGDYVTLGDRYVESALVHSAKAFCTFDITPRLTFELGLDHYAVWAGKGEHAVAGFSLSNYYRVIIGKNAGSDGSGSDKANCIGDQGGAELFKLAYRGKGFTLSFQHEIPYNDGSGMLFRNFPDGVNTLCFSFDSKDRWVSDVLYEYTWTMWQSGSLNTESYNPDIYGPVPPEANTQGGDNYFNNGEYADGWVHLGRTIGYPLFFASEPNGQGLVLGVGNNRLKAHHLGLAGKFFRKAPYKLMLTYSMNHGTYPQPYTGPDQWQRPWKSVKEEGLPQFSAALTGEIPLAKGLCLTYGAYLDSGKVLPDTCAATLGIRWIAGL
ncbi:MAG: capsule assembly Wzi family protein [Candidatus Cryptobacteroides sp.]